MFDDLDASLAAVLADQAAPAEVRAADVSFAAPDKDFAPAQPTLNLFLHEVQENRALRVDAPVLERVAGGFVSHRPPLRVDCTYLVTAWSPKTAGARTAEEHRLLGRALLWLSRFAVVDPSYLQAGLNNPAQPYPVTTVVAQTREGQPVGEFWSALGVPPRPAFSLAATISLLPFPEEETFEGVESVELRTTSVTDPSLQGRVRDAALGPVAGAVVTLVEVGVDATADAAGGFRFPGVPFGNYSLSVHAAGHPDAIRSIEYARQAQVHDVILTGN